MFGFFLYFFPTSIVLQCVALCCGVLQCVAARYNVLQCAAARYNMFKCVVVFNSVLQGVAGCCRVLQ